jgi:hypothetical protein
MATKTTGRHPDYINIGIRKVYVAPMDKLAEDLDLNRSQLCRLAIRNLLEQHGIELRLYDLPKGEAKTA